MVGGWFHHLALYQDTGDVESTPYKAMGQGVHNDDILCMAHQESGMVASGSYDGDVVVWNIDMERYACVCMCMVNSRPSLKARAESTVWI